MSELRRWSEEGATDEEARLLTSARKVRISSASHARIAASLGAGASLLASSTASGAAAGSAGLIAKLAGAVVFVGVVGAVAVHTLRPASEPAPARRTQAAVSAPVPAATAAPSPAASAPAEQSPETTENHAAAGSASPVRSARARAAASGHVLEEVKVLDRARAALAASSPDAALRELTAYRQRFPGGALASEETVLRVQALLARGDAARAVSLADQFAAAHPESPYARRVLALVAGVRSKP